MAATVGVGSDRSGTIINYGTIIGTYDGSGNGDGDGIDIDHVGYVENYGTIQALGAAGTHSDGRPNGSDGVTFGDGGTFINHSGALVDSVTTGVAFGVQATVVNDGTIHAGGVAVGTDIGNDLVVNSGTIISDSGLAISMGSGDDQLTLLPGSTIVGTVDGGDGMDQITLAGEGSGSFAGAVNFEHLAVDSGNWTLTGASTFNDGTTIASGAALSGSAAVLIGNMDNAGTLTIDQPTDAAFTATLTGQGQVIKAGAGTLTIGDQSFTGPTRIAGGTLLVSGSLPSAMTVGSGAILGGQGSVGSIAVESGGLVAPGAGGGGTLDATNVEVQSGGTIRSSADGAGSLVIHGNLVQQAGSLYEVGIRTGQVGASLTVDGTATLQDGALISLSPETGSDAIGTRYTLLSAAGGITGNYTIVQAQQADTEIRLSMSGDAVYGLIARTAESLSRIGSSPNQIAVAKPLAALGVGNAAYAALTVSPSDDAVRTGLSELAGEVHASARTAMTQDALRAEDAIRSRLDGLISSRAGLWVQFLGGHGRDDGKAGTASADRDTIGGIGGADISIGENIQIGVAGGYTRTHLKMDGIASRARIGSAHLLGYAGADRGAFRLRAAVGYVWNHVDTHRSIAFDGFSDQDRAHYRADTLHGFGEIGYAFAYSKISIEPFLRGTAIRVHTDGFLESGGAAALSGAAQTATTEFSDIGIRLKVPLLETVDLGGSLSWRHAFDRIRSRATLAFAAGGDPFSVIGTSISRDAVSPAIDIGWTPAPRVRLAAGYVGLYGSRSRENSGRITLAIGF